MKARFLAVISAIILLSFTMPVYADVVPGIIKALSDLHDAYETYSTVKEAVDAAENENKKPSLDFTQAAKKYQTASGNLVAIPLPSSPGVDSSVGAVQSCAQRNVTIPALIAGIGNIQASLNAVQSEISQLNTADNEVTQTFALAVQIEKAIPKIEEIPIWGDAIAADIFTNNQKVRRAAGDAKDTIAKRLKQDNAVSTTLSANLSTWSNALTTARQFSAAPAPPGSYTASCNACTHDCEQITCNCRRINGTFIRTSIAYPSCHSVQNIDGNLRCGP